MSVQFGRWNFEGQPPDPDYIDKVSAALAPYGPDSNESYCNGGVRILYRAFHTTMESRCEKQPYICPSGAVIAWDGRLDNRTDLMNELSDPLIINCTDVAVVGAAYEKWGQNCLRRLIGDWAISIWNPRERSVLLAKDPLGTKHLYYCYSFNDKQVTWSTILDPLVLFAGKTLEICEEYIAGWFSYFPAAHLTPYSAIQSVPPSSSVLINSGTHTVKKYWDFDPEKTIHYRNDAEYEEHFRIVFATAVKRRLRSDRPVLAELSGGLDSSSIVCVADAVVAGGLGETARLDTISWYDDSYDHVEPDTNELHWITKVEEKRGRTGHHIDLGSLNKDARSQNSPASEFNEDHFVSNPSIDKDLPEHFKLYAAYMHSEGHRVTLSGIGGDEITSGDVPTPTPELRDLLARGRFSTLVRKLNAWAVKMRRSKTSMLWRAARGFMSPQFTGVSIHMQPAPWFDPGFVRRNFAALCGYPSRMKLVGPLPSFQENIVVLNVLRRLLATLPSRPDMLREIRFPYLDRDFLEFMYAIPREQIVGVGKRRFLMKRALADIVPDEVLNRRRKPFVQQVFKQAQKENSGAEWTAGSVIRQPQIVSSSIGLIDPDRFADALQQALHSEEARTYSLNRTIRLECWLRHLAIQGVLKNSVSMKAQITCLSIPNRPGNPHSHACGQASR